MRFCIVNTIKSALMSVRCLCAAPVSAADVAKVGTCLLSSCQVSPLRSRMFQSLPWPWQEHASKLKPAVPSQNTCLCLHRQCVFHWLTSL